MTTHDAATTYVHDNPGTTFADELQARFVAAAINFAHDNVETFAEELGIDVDRVEIQADHVNLGALIGDRDSGTHVRPPSFFATYFAFMSDDDADAAFRVELVEEADLV